MITARWEYEVRLLQKAEEKSVELPREIKEFLGHFLRNKLNEQLYISELVRRGVNEPQVADYLETTIRDIVDILEIIGC